MKHEVYSRTKNLREKQLKRLRKVWFVKHQIDMCIDFHEKRPSYMFEDDCKMLNIENNETNLKLLKELASPNFNNIFDLFEYSKKFPL